MNKADAILMKFDGFKDLSKKKRRKIVTKLFLSDDFIQMMFDPDIDNLGNKQLMKDKVSEIYTKFMSPAAIVALIDMLEHEGTQEFNPTHATFINSIVGIAIEDIDNYASQIDMMRSEGKITRSQVEEKTKKLQAYSDDIAKLIKLMHKIVKPYVSKLQDYVDIPYVYADILLINNPSARYINKYRLGYYLNRSLMMMYEEANEHGTRFPFDSEDWSKLFKTLYGDKNTVECATFILLEGAGRLSKYNKNKKAVTELWDSLTAFALEELDHTSDNTREHMLELYIKRVDKMVKNGAKEFRIDLTKLPDIDYPRLARTVEKYINRIRDILDRRK